MVDLAIATRMLGLAVRERLARPGRGRVPEPMVMDEVEAVDAFDSADPILQLPIYRFNARAQSALLPENGRVLDLGSATGRLLAHLATARPDVSIVGTDLADNMLRVGNTMLEDEGLADRVSLVKADITDLPSELTEGVDLVTCVWTLHQLPDADMVRRTLTQVAEIRRRSGCAVWLFDFARLRRPDTIPAVIRLSPDAPRRLVDDGIASEQAAWTAEELTGIAADAALTGMSGGRNRLLGHLQAWWIDGKQGADHLWSVGPLTGRSAELFKAIWRTTPHP